MLIKPECIPCILNVAITAIRELDLDENSVEELYSEILEIPALRGLFWEIASSEVIEEIWRIIVKRTNNPDPFHSHKLNQNEKMLAQYPLLEKIVDEADDPLYPAVKLAILGNSLDLMVADTSNQTLKNSIAERLNAPLSNGIYSEFKRQLYASNLLIYFGDNAGEIVLDKLLIETIQKLLPLEIVFVVRGTPTLNDATLKEAGSIGLDQAVRVIANGIEGPLPGTILSRCSSEVNDWVNQSDLIISKGGGNFDTLDEERKHLKKKFTFMLLSKCPVYSRYFNVEISHPIMANFY
jgi:uncharacterized protein with ATP-grasp and redox domains